MQKGFTFIEFLATLAILVMLTAQISPSIHAYLDQFNEETGISKTIPTPATTPYDTARKRSSDLQR